MIASSTEVEYFLEVYGTRHISKAAIRLGVTQPTLTVSLQKLESKLGVKLFHRSKQGVVPTAQGLVFFQKASRLMENWKEVQEGLYASSTEIQGKFKIGCHPNVGAYTLPKFIANLQKNAPKIEIDLVHDFSRKIIEKIVSFEVDLGFVVNPVRHPDLVLKKIGIDQVLFWKSSELDSHSRLIFADLSTSRSQEAFDKAYSKRFKDWKLVSTSSMDLIRALTLSGQGIGILPERVARVGGAKLTPYDKDLPVYEDQIFLAYRKDVLASKAGRELIKAATFEL